MKTFYSSRRRFVLGAGAMGVLSGCGVLPTQHQNVESRYKAPSRLSGTEFDLTSQFTDVNFTGKARVATSYNGSLPGPILHWREGERVTIRAHNALPVDSSVHWHGIILPNAMDGVPGMTFDGIKPGETFEYEFDVVQSGTYWYHSHSGFQEQTGAYGAIVIESEAGPRHTYDREYVVQLSDWSDEDPHKIYAKLKKLSHYYNFNERTVADSWREIADKGLAKTWSDRKMWNQMRMSERDIADVTGYTYTYLMNGVPPATGWRGLFNKGERVLLRFINSSAMTIFDVRIPGLKLTVVAADGQPVRPVTVDEFRIGVAETYDVLVEPEGDAYTVFAQSIDRSGYCRGTLATAVSLEALIPAMDPAPVLGHRDMGMSHDSKSMSHADMNHQAMSHESMQMSHEGMSHQMMSHDGMSHSNMKHGGMPMTAERHAAMGDLGAAGFGSTAPIVHPASEKGVGIDMRSMSPQDGIADPGIGLRDHAERFGRKVLRYADLKADYMTEDRRQPSRELQLHLTGNMHRYMWSMDGVAYADADPIRLQLGERVRFVIVNDTMMTHPIHLHGMWSELETGEPMAIPKKHTILVQPGSKASYLVTADALGRWAFHCHLLYHMGGMFREVQVV